MKSRIRGVVMAVLVVLVAPVGPAAAELPPAPECAAGVEGLRREWREIWSWVEPRKAGGGAMVKDNHGHQYSAAEYESMRRRLDRSLDLCRGGAVDEARAEMWIVRSWLDADYDRPLPIR